MLLAATPPPVETPPHTGGLLLLIDGTAGLLTVAARLSESRSSSS